VAPLPSAVWAVSLLHRTDVVAPRRHCHARVKDLPAWHGIEAAVVSVPGKGALEKETEGLLGEIIGGGTE
jgi:hypothetical protein